ncbi:hypothetical protein [Paraprevotella xylaniphila]|uniref:hypothetical protein n=1 Tax=Paraprevotella xylaniphila TaxID=454155 RepID=UPI0039F579BC
METLLTEEQKQTVKYLTVTGTLLDEDYAFLRGGLLEQLDTLDLRDAEIDTIPAGALGAMELYLVLPKMIECIWDYAFKGVCEVTGNAPFLGEYKNDPYYKPLMQASKGHPNLMNIERDSYSAVYSQNGDTLYYLKPGEHLLNWGGDMEIRSDTRVIAQTAMRNEPFPVGMINLVLPESMEFIGNYALDITLLLPTGYISKNRYPHGGEYGRGSVICEAANPPKLDILGDGFWVAWSYLYVPESSLEAYKVASGWKLARKIDTIENLLKQGQNIQSIHGGETASISITSMNENYILFFSKEPLQMDLLSTDGGLLSSQMISSAKVTLPKKSLQKPLTIVRVRFTDGTNETVKLIP